MMEVQSEGQGGKGGEGGKGGVRVFGDVGRVCGGDAHTPPRGRARGRRRDWRRGVVQVQQAGRARGRRREG